jgi:hypothetical protein
MVLSPIACILKPIKEQNIEDGITKKVVCGNYMYRADLSNYPLNLNGQSASSVRNLTVPNTLYVGLCLLCRQRYETKGL